MKQILFLLLFPCLAMAQYQGNAGQKITLGEQTTADGLVYRGLAADTTRKPSVDTMAYILLDTNTNIIWQYKKAVNNAWTKINLTQADTSSFNYVNTYGTQTVNGEKTFTSAVTATRFNPTASTATGTGMFLPASNTLGFSTNGIERFRQTNSTLSINNISPLGYPLEVYGTNANTRIVIRGTTNPLVTQYAGDGGTWYMGMDDSAGANYTGIAYARFIYSSLDKPFIFFTNVTERLKIHGDGGLKFKPQTVPTAEEGTVYYDSSTKKLKVYNGTSWIDLH